MRRDRMIIAVERLREALQVSKIREILHENYENEEDREVKRSQVILSAYSVFSQHHLDFGEEEKQFMSLFGLNPLVNVNFWSGLIEQDDTISPEILSDIKGGIYNILFVMPKLKELLFRETEKDVLLVKLDDGEQHEVRRLHVFITDINNALTATTVIIKIFKAFEDFYEGVSYMHKTKYVALSIGSVDSDKVKVVDFFGSSEIIEDISDILASVWLRVRYAIKDNIRYQIEVAMMATGFIARVNEAQKSALITEEEGQRITRVVAASIETILHSGAYTESMDQFENMRAGDVMQNRSEELGGEITKNLELTIPSRPFHFLEKDSGPLSKKNGATPLAKATDTQEPVKVSDEAVATIVALSKEKQRSEVAS